MILSQHKNSLIEFDELQKVLSFEDVKVIDFRKPQHYQKDHIPGALNVWRSHIRSKNFPYSGMKASKEEVELLFSDLGIKNGDWIIIYDDMGLCDAARLWWLLQLYNYDKVQLLNGSYSRWKENYEATSNTLPIHKTNFKFEKDPDYRMYIDKEGVLNSIGKKLILDTRTTDEFSGKRQKKGAYKGGRIPESIRIDWAVAVNYHGDRKMKTIEELKEAYKEVLKYKEDTIITYCQSGTRSAHTTFVLTQLLGMKHVQNYDGSWIEWSYFNDLPFEKDSITTIFE
ncbi:sulfurtransferase [Pseudotenacibaculum haliotis]|uniref:Sulfurtransferase n=1 Tax=Pseudotenacibaculum haliotis TaxID=1862138 RepID=A0ABW5LNP1_9FLAO